MGIIVVALLASTIGPGMLSLITGYVRRAEKRGQWERDDKVASDVPLVVKGDRVDGYRS